MRTCTACDPFSILRMSDPSASLSPSSRAPEPARNSSNDGAPGAHSPFNIGASAQNGDAGPSVPWGSSRASNPHSSTRRSAFD